MSILHDDDAIKESFRRVKEHMALLEKELRADREFIIVLNSTIEQLSSRVRVLEDKLDNKEQIIEKEFIDKVNKPKIEDLENNNLIIEEKEVISNSGMVSPSERKGYLAPRHT